MARGGILKPAHEGSPGEHLRAIRVGLGISTRRVEWHSHHIALSRRSSEYRISHGFLSNVEKRNATPSIYRLFTLSIIYRINFAELLLFYGLDLNEISKLQLEIPLPRTHLVDHHIYDAQRPVRFPVKFDPGVREGETNLLSRMVQTWGEIPIGFLQNLALRQYMYGFIGVDDDTLYPIVRPGSFVQIDDTDTTIAESGGDNEFERPIYFLRLRTGYIFGWCDVQENVLTVIPSKLSKTPIRRFDLSNEVDVIGRIVAVAMSLRQGRRHDPLS